MKKLSLLWGIALTLLLSFSTIHAEDFWQDTLWIRKIPLGGHVFSKVLFHPDGKSLFAASDQYLFRYDVQTGSIINTFEMKEKGYIRDYEISRDKQNLILITDIRNNGNIPCFELWNIDTGYVRHYRYDNVKSESQTSSMAMGGNDSLLYVGVEHVDGSVHIIDYKSGKFIESKIGAGRYIDISPDGKYMASAYLTTGAAGRTKLIDIEKWQTISFVTDIFEPKFSPDGRFFAGREDMSDILLYDMENKKGYSLKGHRGKISDMCFTSDSKYLVSAAHGESVPEPSKGGYRIWEISSKKQVFEAPYFTGTSGYLFVSSDNSLYATIGKGDGIFVSLWKFRGVVNSLPESEENMNTISIIPNPSFHTVTINYPLIKENAFLIIRDISGKELYKKYLTESDKINGSIIIPISNYPNGTYLCTVVVNNLPFLTSSFIINR